MRVRPPFQRREHHPACSAAPHDQVPGLRARPGVARWLLRWAGTFVPAFIPLSLLSGGTSTGGRLATAAAIAVLAQIVAVLVTMGVLPFRRTYLWITLLAGLLVISFLFPLTVIPATPQPERHHIADLLGILRGMTPTQLSRLSDLVGLLAGLVLTGVTAALAARPGQVARVIALTGAVATGYALCRGDYVGGRLEALGCNANYLALLLALPVVASVGLVRLTRRAAWLAPAALCFVALTDTQSRGAFLAAGTGVAFILVQGRSAMFRSGLAICGVMLGAAAFMMGRFSSVEDFVASVGAGDRTAASLSTDNGVRARVAELALRVIIEHPLRGIGYWMFPAYAQRAPDFGQYLTTHDDYLRLAAEAGLPALIAFLVLLRPAIASRRTGDLAVLRAVVVAYLVAMFFANPLASLVVSAPFWIALGCLLAPAPAAAASPSPYPDDSATTAVYAGDVPSAHRP